MGRPAARGAQSMGAFAKRFVEARLTGFVKDMRICLTGIKLDGKKKPTHAYFPALGACCATLEYLAGLYHGLVGDSVSQNHIRTFANTYLPQPDYDAEAIRVLHDGFRHPVAHRGIASGVWTDQHADPQFHGRRVVWTIYANARKPALRLLPEHGQLLSDPPWPCAYTHVAHIHLVTLWRDVQEAGLRYATDAERDAALTAKFTTAMERLYPRLPP